MKHSPKLRKLVIMAKIFITPDCNNNCKFCICGVERRYANKSKKHIQNELKTIRKKHSDIIFTGGEPTTRPDIIQIISYAKKIGFRKIHIQTNGRMFSYVDFCKKIINAGANSFSVILWANNTFHDHITRTPKSLLQTIEGIHNLKEMKVHIEIILPTFKENLFFLKEIFDYSKKQGIEKIKLLYPFEISSNTNREHSTQQSDLSLTTPKFSEIIQEVQKLSHFYKSLQIEFAGIPFCLLPPNLLKGYKKSASKIVTSKNVKLDKCDACDYKVKCPGIPKSYLKIYGDREFLPISFFNEVNIEVTPNCNLSCNFCYNKHYTFKKGDKIPKQMTTDEIKEIIDKLADQRAMIVNFIGGEPLFRKDIKLLLEYAKSKGMYIKLTTNGTLIDKNNVKFIKKFVNQVILSLHGCDEEREHEITGNKKQFWKRKVDAIKILVRNNCRVTLISIATRENIRDLEKFFDFVNGLGIDGLILLRPMPDSKNKNPMNKKDVKQLVDKLILLEEIYGKKFDIGNALPFCSYTPEKIRHFVSHRCLNDAEKQITINPEGSITPCNIMSGVIGKIHDVKLKDVWLNDSFIKQVKNLNLLPKACKECRFVTECRGGCRAAAKMVFGKYDAPDPLAEPGF